MICKNCGKCCQKIIYVSIAEFSRIAEHLLTEDEELLKIHQKQVAYRNPLALFCDFRDDINGNCIIHDVLPFACKSDCKKGFVEKNEKISLHDTLIFKDENVKNNILKMLDLFSIKGGL